MAGINIPVRSDDSQVKKGLQDLNKSLAEMAKQADLVSKNFRGLENKAAKNYGKDFRQATKDVKKFGDQSTKSLYRTGNETNKLANRVTGLITSINILAATTTAYFTGNAILKAGDNIIRYNKHIERDTNIIKILIDKGHSVCRVINDSIKPATMKKGTRLSTIFNPLFADFWNE